MSLASVLDCVTASIPNWSALFLPEFDGYTRDIQPPASEHIVHRHYPGEGSFSIAWTINRKLQNHLQDISWQGRAGSILLEPPGRGKRKSSLYAVGVHGGHGDALLDSFTDIVTLIRRKPRHSHLILLGDFNIDLLPSLAQDPWDDLPDRSECHRARRILLDTFASSLKLETVIPSRVESSPGGPFGDQAYLAPFTRIPVGACTSTQLPSFLDFFMRSSNKEIFLDTWVDWLPAVADHALVGATVACEAEPFNNSVASFIVEIGMLLLIG